MILDFNQFVLEALTLKKDGGAHYLDRVNTRLANLTLVDLVTKNGESVKVEPAEFKEIETFYRGALQAIADPSTSKLFKDTDVASGVIGIIRLGKLKVTTSNGIECEPKFKVYERTDKANGQPVYRTGSCFWLFTIGQTVSTIKLYDVDGNSKSDKEFLINKSIDHLVADRQAELAKISRVFSINLDSKDALAKQHQIILTPAGISIIKLDLSSNMSSQDQLIDFLNANTFEIKPEAKFTQQVEIDPNFKIEQVPKQMNITPGKVWILEKNEKFDTWGAVPIIASSLDRGVINIKVGKKWLHWLDKLDPPKVPNFNTPLKIDRTISKGDQVTLAKELGNGDWQVNIGTVTDISIDARSSDYPYVKTAGWDETFIIPAKEADQIFRTPQMVTESLLDFNQWINL